MKATPKKAQAKRKNAPGAGRPSQGGRQRPILPRTTVAPATLAGIKGEGRPTGHVIDDMWGCWEVTRKAALRLGVPHERYLLGLA